MEKTAELEIKNDDVVQMAYNLSVGGEEVESNTFEYLHGYHNLIPGLETELTGLKLGEVKEVHVKAADAYGEFDPQLVVPVNRASFPKDFEIRLGETMRMRDQEGHVFTGVATEMDDEVVKVDMNHPMAGKDLDFKVTILDIRPGTEDELRSGMVGGGCSSCSSCGDGCSDGCC